MNQLVIKFDKPLKDITEQLLDYLSIFLSLSNQNLPEIQINEMNVIPKWITADWKIYKEILSHIVMMAIKTSGSYGKININVSYQTFEDCKSSNQGGRARPDLLAYDRGILNSEGSAAS